MLKYIAVASLIFAFTLQPSHILKQHCSGGEDPNYIPNYQFFEPISFAEMSNFDWKYDDSLEDNLKDWKKYLGNKPDIEDLREIVFGTSAENMQVIRAYITNSSTMIDSKLKSNSVVKYLVQNKDLQTADYLYFAKVCEKQAQGNTKWEDTPTRDITQTKWLADASKTYYNDKEKASTTFLKMRFAYQAVRMAHYSKQYDKAIKFYDELVTPIFDKTDSPIKYWALALKAGALKRNGKAAEATYIFAQVFENCPSRRASTYLSLDLDKQEEWIGGLSLCKTPQEKANLYFLRGIYPTANGLEELNNIFKIAPESDKITILIAKEMQKLEKGVLLKYDEMEKNVLFTKSFNKGHDQIQSFNPFVSTFKDILNNIKSNPKIARPDITLLALGYLDYLENKHTSALAKWSEVQKMTKDTKMQKQIAVLQIAQKITALQNIDEKIEDDIFEQVQKTKHIPLQEYMVMAFGKLYESQGQIGKAFLCKNDMWQLHTKYNLPLVKDLIQVANKKKISNVEKFLLAKISDKKPENVLTELHATILFSQDNLDEAIALYQSLPENALHKLEKNPFTATIKDCRDCGENAKYTRLSLAQKIQNYKKLSQKPSQDQANQYLLLGNAYYNMTFFGNSWNAVDYYRSNLDIPEPINGEVVFLDCEKAKFYYERAYSVALKDQNQELAAQSAFMAAKCEQNMYYIKQFKKAKADKSYVYDLFLPPSYLPENRRYFAKLKELKNTKFYQQAKTECAYFNRYLTISKK